MPTPQRTNRAEQAGLVLGYPFNLQPKETCLSECLKALSEGKSQHVVTLNPELIIYAHGDSQYREILQNADWSIPDGAGIIWALQRQGIHHVKRLPGIEFSEALIEQAAQRGLKVALIGGEESINQDACKALKAKFPRLQISYAHHGFFNEAEEVEIAKAAADSGAQLVFLALGFPRQEFWIRKFQPQFPHATIMLGVGGSFDVWSGHKKRAPRLFCKLHLEWLYRITSEPWRIRRVAKSLPEYLVKAVLLNHNSL